MPKFIHPFYIKGHLNYFQLELAITNNAAKNTRVISPGPIILRVVLLGHRVYVWLALVRTASVCSNSSA